MSDPDARRRGRGASPVADFAKRGAMALAALAFSAGLYAQLGLNFVSALAGGLALFAMMALSHAAYRRATDNAGAIARLMGSSTALARLDDLTLNMEQVGDVALRQEELVARLDEIERFLASASEAMTAPPPPAPQENPAQTAQLSKMLAQRGAQIDRLTAEIDRLNARFEALRNQSQIDARERHERVAAELKMLETLIKQLAEQIATGGMQRQAERAASVAAAVEEAAVTWTTETAAPPLREEPRVAPPQPEPYAEPEPHYAEEPEEEPLFDSDRLDAAILEAVRRSVEANKVDLYLQPIVMLPQRRVRYYEALTRLRDRAGHILMPKDYLGVAERAGMMPLIDNVMLYRSVQVLRRLSERASAKGVFCNISLHSLLDPEFFPEFIAFMEQNSELADSLFFEFSQPMMKNCGPIELESLGALAGLGFRFVLDQVQDLDIDYEALHDKGFRFMKMEADLLLHRTAQAGARIHAADMHAYLDRQGLTLIVEKIEDERTLMDLLDFDIRLGQGYLFSEPRPVRPEVYGAGDDAAAAA